jgi:hypothetical protein
MRQRKKKKLRLERMFEPELQHKQQRAVFAGRYRLALLLRSIGATQDEVVLTSVQGRSLCPSV